MIESIVIKRMFKPVKSGERERPGYYRVTVFEMDGTTASTGHWETVKAALAEAVRLAKVSESANAPNPTPGRVVRGGITKRPSPRCPQMLGSIQCSGLAGHGGNHEFEEEFI